MASVKKQEDCARFIKDKGQKQRSKIVLERKESGREEKMTTKSSACKPLSSFFSSFLSSESFLLHFFHSPLQSVDRSFLIAPSQSRVVHLLLAEAALRLGYTTLL